jgi:hypothetical protein
MSTLLLGHLLHEGLVCGLGEPALLIQQGQESRRVGLTINRKGRVSQIPKFKTLILLLILGS